MNKDCKHRWEFQRSHFTCEPDGRYYSIYTRYDYYICADCGMERWVLVRREICRWRPLWYRPVREERRSL